MILPSEPVNEPESGRVASQANAFSEADVPSASQPT